jgi:hypothetical protein
MKTKGNIMTNKLHEIRNRIRDQLQPLTEDDIESGYFFGTEEYEPYGELFVKIDGREYSVQIREMNCLHDNGARDDA